MQLDLFAHSADVGLRNAVVTALRAHDANAMRAATDRLRADFPDDGHLEHFEHLFSELSALDQGKQSAPAIARQVERIETQLLPALNRMIGNDAARRWIEPVYGALAHAACGQTFNRSLSSAHAAGLFLRAGELALARAGVTEIPSWRRIPEPLAWMTEIALREKAPDEYWPLVAELAWIAPALLADLFPRTAPATALRLYQEFCITFENEDRETPYFPAWLLVEHPDLLQSLRLAQPQESPPARSAALLIDLLIGERQGLTPAILDKRRELRGLAPTIFERYMARR
jgi:hypothetical protein